MNEGISDTIVSNASIQCEVNVIDNTTVQSNNDSYRVRFIYNSEVTPRRVDAFLAKKF